MLVMISFKPCQHYLFQALSTLCRKSRALKVCACQRRPRKNLSSTCHCVVATEQESAQCMQFCSKTKFVVGVLYAESVLADYKTGFGGEFGVQEDRQDRSALGWDHVEKLQKHDSQKGWPFFIFSQIKDLFISSVDIFSKNFQLSLGNIKDRETYLTHLFLQLIMSECRHKFVSSRIRLTDN